jgi:tRNA threonylcarbamoyladenosine biosynthesis protein TsaE
MPDAELSLSEMRAWGEALGARLEPPAIVTLEGELGSGKTTLVQAICRGYGALEPATSPTFALVHEYHAPRSSVLHLDLYRLEGPHELANIGWDDVLSSGALVVVEWPERAGADAALQASATIALRLAHVPGAADKRRVFW